MLTKQAALDDGPLKIRCNAVCPGPTRTAMLEEALSPLTQTLRTDVDGVFACISSNVPLRQVAAPEEVSVVCANLASDDSSFVTGSVPLLDGGESVDLVIRPLPGKASLSVLLPAQRVPSVFRNQGLLFGDELDLFPGADGCRRFRCGKMGSASRGKRLDFFLTTVKKAGRKSLTSDFSRSGSRVRRLDEEDILSGQKQKDV